MLGARTAIPSPGVRRPHNRAATVRASSTNGEMSSYTLRAALETLGNAMTSGRVYALSGDADGRNETQRRALGRVLERLTTADADETDEEGAARKSAVEALSEGAAKHDAAESAETRWDALRNAYDVAMRAMLNADLGVGRGPRTFVSMAGAGAGSCEKALMRFTSERSDASAWRSLNDGVMGGMSDGFFATNADGSGMFVGNVSLERNGGFASVRAGVDEDASAFAGVYLDAKAGDAASAKKTWLFILKDEDCMYDQINFKVAFTVTNELGRVKIPFSAFSTPERMGRVVVRPPVDCARLREFGLMILKGDASQVGPFSLHITEVGFYRDHR